MDVPRSTTTHIHSPATPRLPRFGTRNNVIADVAADGLMVEFAQREPEEKRGTIQTTIYLVRTLGMVFAVALVGIGMNGKEYQGTFDFSLTYSQVMLIFSLPAGAMVPISWFLVQDSPIQPGERKSFKMYCSQAWALITNKAKGARGQT
ncbi:unnamed protein product [Cladocopium goreaui]|uniref:Folate-biopterin transporter family n=1 Tax=Cladocopium goreaui TaxID=2562237 RepID=A0A9P1FS03_9DINO|nr:unnamed protein product [Cladocopium goreaui]